MLPPRWFALLWLAGLPQAAPAQRVLYDGQRDSQAQAAASASREVLSGSLFETQLRNLEQLGRQQLETMVRWQEVRLRAALNGFTRWSDVARVLDRVDERIAPLLDSEGEAAHAAARLEQVRARAAEFPKLLREVQTARGERSDLAAELLSRLGQSKEAVGFAEGILGKENAGRVRALTEVAAALEQVGKLYVSLSGSLKAAAAVKVPAGSLAPDPLTVELELLRVEEEHWKTLGMIRARQALEAGEIKKIVDRARLLTRRFPPGDAIEETLAGLNTQAARERLEFAVYAVHYAAAAAAQQETSADLALLRKSLEERRYSIRRSAVHASGYEQTARAAADRLAAYWRSGLRPKDLGELLFHLSTAVSLPLLAVRQ